MPQKDPSRTEKATPKQVKKARKEGNVPKGQELAKTLLLMAGIIALRYFIPYYYERLHAIFSWAFTDAIGMEVDKAKAYELLTWVFIQIAYLVLPLLLILAFVAIVVMRLQIGKLWTTKVFRPKFSKIFNIVGGLQNIFFSLSTFVRLGRSLLQAAAVAIAPYIVIKQELFNLMPLFYQTPTQVAAYILGVGYKMCVYALIPMLFIAIADTWYTRWDYQEQLKMTKDEVKDERKQMEGDPKIKAKQQQKMMQMMASRMMQDVPRADVVVTNPTHLAVALMYNVMEAPAPLVLAKGAGDIAKKIKEIAKENKIPIQEDKPLAQALYKQVDIGQTIPEEMYQAVAALLAKLDKFKRRQG